MSVVTVNLPVVGTNAVFSFKDPFSKLVSNKLNTPASGVALQVTSISSMKDMIRLTRFDPYTEIYSKVKLGEVEYKQDLNDDIKILTLTHLDADGIATHIQVPLTYIRSISEPNAIQYIDRGLVIGLGHLPVDLDLDPHREQIADYVRTLIGVKVTVCDVSVGTVKHKSSIDHDALEEIRKNSVKVHKTTEIQLAEARLTINSMVDRLNELGIVLGGDEDE